MSTVKMRCAIHVCIFLERQGDDFHQAMEGLVIGSSVQWLRAG